MRSICAGINCTYLFVTRRFFFILLKINQLKINIMDKIKCITFDKNAQDSLPQHIKDKMKADREKAQLKRNKIVCYCGSLRFKSYFEKFEYNSVFKGEIALLPCCMFVDIEREYGATSDYKQKADEQHKRKIDICDEVFVINVGGYIGESTRSEINYALSINKPVVYLVP